MPCHIDEPRRTRPEDCPLQKVAFFYIAGADLIPITHREKFDMRAVVEMLVLFAGIGVIAAVGFLIV